MIQSGKFRVLPQDVALERVREIIALVNDLAGDFRRVRDQFYILNQNLREQIMNNDGSRGSVLDAVFAGIDLISDSDSGRTFAAFWRLLIDPEQSAILEQALDEVISREFIEYLDWRERQFLFRMTRSLLEQGGLVHEVLHTFARSLKHFVQSREYLEQRLLTKLLKDAQSSALDIKDNINAATTLQYTLELTSSRLSSLSQLVLYDPALQSLPAQMNYGGSLHIGLENIVELLSQSEIDFRTIKSNICAVLQQNAQASIADVLEKFPATQGLGSVVGLIALGSRHGFKMESNENVAWIGNDEQKRSACIPKMLFVRERIHELE